MSSLHRALRRRLELARATEAGDDGFMLIYVLMVTGVIVTLVASAVVVAGAALVPAVQANYNQAATAAAQGGFQDFLASVRSRCAPPNASVDLCTGMPASSGATATRITTTGAGSGYTATYRWTAQRVTSVTPAYFRVTSVGTAAQGGTSASRTLVADIVGAASLDVLDYGVVTGYESESASAELAQWPARTVAFTCTGVRAADVPIDPSNRCDTTTPPVVGWRGTTASQVGVCNATYGAAGGRATTHPSGAPSPYVDWSESTTDGSSTNYQPCQTSLGSFTRLLAPASTANGTGGYYSADALLLSNSYPGGAGPTLNQPVTSLWDYSKGGGGCGTAAGRAYRALSLGCAGYPTEIGGAPSTTSSFPSVQTVAQGPLVPTAAPSIPTGACVYAGPTRARLTGTTAVVTSPQTTLAWVAANASTRPAQCYTGATAGGMAEQTVSLASPVRITVLKAANTGTIPTSTPTSGRYGSSGWPLTGQKATDPASAATSLFYFTSGTSSTTTASAYTVAAAPSTYTPVAGSAPPSTDGAWTPQWTSFSTGTSCTTSTATLDLKFFNCYYNGNNNSSSGYSPTSYATLRTALTTAIAGNPAAYTSDAAVATNLQTLVQNLVKTGNSADAAASTPSSATNVSHRWTAGTATTTAAANCTPSGAVAGTTTSTTVPAPSSDAFFTNANGTSTSAPTTTTTCYTVPVTAQVGTCTLLNLLVCIGQGWGDGSGLLGGGKSVAQFTVTFTIKKTTTTTTVTVGSSAFPNPGDITQYQKGSSSTSGPGDLYVEGNADATTALVGADDVIITGSLRPTSASTAALEVVAQNDVRVYHPVTCTVPSGLGAAVFAAALAATDAGFCPNDTTGLYSNQPSSGQTSYDQYTNLRSDLANLTVQAAVFALGNADAHLTCPQPSTAGGGVCGGDFTVDNYNRGATLGQLTLVGTLAMAHHAPVGQEWEITDTTGATTRPWSGYQMSQQYLYLKGLITASTDVSNVLQTRSVTSAQWHVLSTSTGRS